MIAIFNEAWLGLACILCEFLCLACVCMCVCVCEWVFISFYGFFFSRSSMGTRKIRERNRKEIEKTSKNSTRIEQMTNRLSSAHFAMSSFVLNWARASVFDLIKSFGWWAILWRCSPHYRQFILLQNWRATRQSRWNTWTRTSTTNGNIAKWLTVDVNGQRWFVLARYFFLIFLVPNVYLEEEEKKKNYEHANYYTRKECTWQLNYIEFERLMWLGLERNLIKFLKRQMPTKSKNAPFCTTGSPVRFASAPHPPAHLALHLLSVDTINILSLFSIAST